VNTKDGFWINKKDEYLINPYTGDVITENLFDNKNNGERVIDANLNIHTGSILGVAGKILAFIVGLIATSLPITGFYIWWGRKKKRKFVSG
jgi:uncharacterized iron-regulated membrane protein